MPTELSDSKWPGSCTKELSSGVDTQWRTTSAMRANLGGCESSMLLGTLSPAVIQYVILDQGDRSQQVPCSLDSSPCQVSNIAMYCDVQVHSSHAMKDLALLTGLKFIRSVAR